MFLGLVHSSLFLELINAAHLNLNVIFYHFTFAHLCVLAERHFAFYKQ